MKKELESMKRMNKEEIKTLKAENEVMKKKLELGHTLTGQEESRNHEHSESKTLTRMEGENKSHHRTVHTTSSGSMGRRHVDTPSLNQSCRYRSRIVGRVQRLISTMAVATRTNMSTPTLLRLAYTRQTMPYSVVSSLPR